MCVFVRGSGGAWTHRCIESIWWTSSCLVICCCFLRLCVLCLSLFSLSVSVRKGAVETRVDVASLAPLFVRVLGWYGVRIVLVD